VLLLPRAKLEEEEEEGRVSGWMKWLVMVCYSVFWCLRWSRKFFLWTSVIDISRTRVGQEDFEEKFVCAGVCVCVYVFVICYEGSWDVCGLTLLGWSPNIHLQVGLNLGDVVPSSCGPVNAGIP